MRIGIRQLASGTSQRNDPAQRSGYGPLPHAYCRMVLVSSVAILVLGACDSKEPEKKPPAAHVHTAPHGGALVDLDGGHIELLIERGTGKMPGYVLDDQAEKAVQMVQKV